MVEISDLRISNLENLERAVIDREQVFEAYLEHMQSSINNYLDTKILPKMQDLLKQTQVLRSHEGKRIQDVMTLYADVVWLLYCMRDLISLTQIAEGYWSCLDLIADLPWDKSLRLRGSDDQEQL